MDIHEYQAKLILAKYGVAVPTGRVAFTLEDVASVLREIGSPPWVVKAQIHAGGRGKGGGIRLVQSKQEVLDAARDMLGMTLVTPQTGPAGKKVRRIYIEQGCQIDRELYLGLIVDRSSSGLLMMASTEGGVEIEEVARQSPEKILSVLIDPAVGMQPFHARRLAFGLGFKDQQVGKVVELLLGVYRTFVANDASLIEINPLAVSQEGKVLALDAKINFDDNALHRNPEIADLRDEDEGDPTETAAQRHHLNYIKLDGDIGCMVNGAGLAMATMDIIKLHGGSPANFLDVGGGATRERVTEAFKIILSDANVKGIFINIFGGIMRCDVIAEGVVAAARQIDLAVPIVVRLEGTNVDLGKRILSDSGLPIVSGESLSDAAEKIVRATTGSG